MASPLPNIMQGEEAEEEGEEVSGRKQKDMTGVRQQQPLLSTLGKLSVPLSNSGR